jgi:putative oxidoreductase
MKAGLRVPTLLRWGLGALLLWASLSKLANFQEFYEGLSGYQLPLPASLLKVVAAVLPWLELVCGLMLLMRVQIRAASLSAALLFGLFALATGQAWARGFTISCGCLNLDFLGLESTSFEFLESPPFACGRALLLSVAAFYLFKTAARASRASAVQTQASKAVRD